MSSFKEWLEWDFQPDNKFDILSDGLSNTVVQTCVTIISTMYSEARFVEKFDGEVVENSEITKLLDKPNPGQSGATFRKIIAEDISQYGNAYIRKVRTVTGQVLELRILQANKVTVLVDGGNNPVGYQYTNTTVELIPKDDVIHLKWLITDPVNRYEGLAPIYGAKRSIQTYNEIQRHIAGTMSRGGLTPLFALTQSKDVEGFGKISESQKGGFRKLWKQITGKANAKNTFSNDDVPFIELPEGRDLKPLGFDMKSLEASTLMQQLETQICSSFRVPPEVAITTAGLNNSTYNNLLVSTRNFVQMTIKPLLVLHGEQISQQLADIDNGRYVETNWNEISVLEPTRDELITQYKDAYGLGVVTVDEYRQQLDLQPLEQPIAVNEPIIEETIVQLSKGQDDFYSIANMDYYTKALEVIESLEGSFSKSHTIAGNELIKAIENELKLRYPDGKDVDALTGVNAIKDSFFEEEYVKSINRQLPTLSKQVIEWSINQAGEPLTDNEKVELTENFKNEVFRGAGFSSKTIMVQLKTASSQIPKGKIGDVIKQLRADGSTLLEVNDKMASRTLATQLTNDTSAKSWEKMDKRLRQNGKKLVKVWFTQRDSRVRPSHKVMEGQTVDVTQPFNYQEYKEVDGELVAIGNPIGLGYPADMPTEESVGAGANCRCVMRPRTVSL